ncbi:hypothetical protein EV421DRAFT_1829240 [Armillaria borealis]|uniref:Uncharacterized protein n=1 Tax=Armillaria borealis TaxID=47425 RepID=A0AA39J9F8_9AGAR|nr:hypothetical protein EV421DRAFT_1829240 [Armillaria borealis]
MSLACSSIVDAKRISLSNKELGLYPARNRIWSQVTVRPGRTAECIQDIYDEFPHTLSYATILTLDSVTTLDYAYIASLVEMMVATSHNLSTLKIWSTPFTLRDPRFITLLAPHFRSIHIDDCTFSVLYRVFVLASSKATVWKIGNSRYNRVAFETSFPHDDGEPVLRQIREDAAKRGSLPLREFHYRCEDENLLHRYLTSRADGLTDPLSILHSPVFRHSILGRLTDLQVLRVCIRTDCTDELQQLLAAAAQTMTELKLNTICRASRLKNRPINLKRCISLTDLELRMTLEDTVGVLRTVSPGSLNSLQVSLSTLRTLYNSETWKGLYEALSNPGCLADDHSVVLDFYTWFDADSIVNESIAVVNGVTASAKLLSGYACLNVYGLVGTSQKIVSKVVVQ